MSLLRQTTVHDCPIQAFPSLILQKPENFVIPSDKPSLWFYSAQGALGKDEELIYTLQYGIFQIKWTAQIILYTPEKHLESLLVKGPMHHALHRQSYETHGDKTLIHEEFEFSSSADLEPILEKMEIIYPLAQQQGVRERKRTEKIKTIKKNVA